MRMLDWISGSSARAAQPARRVAGDRIALHAHPAHVNTLVELLGVVGGVVLSDAAALLGGVIRLLRTGRQTREESHQANQAQQSHVMLLGQRIWSDRDRG